jgi:iron complex outermembrane recepter protein
MAALRGGENQHRSPYKKEGESVKKLIWNSVSLVSLATGSVAMAQDGAPTGAAGPGQAASVSADTDGQIGDIIVTASRRAETAQRSAMAIQAFSSEGLARNNVTKPEDISSIAVGIVISSSPQAQPYIRGVGAFAGTSFNESGVAISADGVYISRPWGTRGLFYDLDRVEVLKGPQGTLYGRNASGGALNIISTRPKLGELSGYLEVGAGNYSLLQETSALNLALGDNVAIRGASQIVRRDGYLSNGTGDEKSSAARLQMLWEPSPDVSLLLGGSYQHAGGTGVGVAYKAPGAKFVPASDPSVTAIYAAEPGIGGLIIGTSTYPQNDPFLRSTVWSVNAELNWNLGFGKLTVIPAFRDGKLRERHYFPGFPVEDAESNQQTSVEARLSSETDRLKWVLGAYFFDEEQRNLDGFDAQHSNLGVQALVLPGEMDHKTISYAVFGQATYSVSDALRFTGGLRYTYERKTIDDQLQFFNFPSGGGTCATGVLDPASPFGPLVCRLDVASAGRKSWNSVTWKAGVEYDAGPRSLVYFNASTGFKSGGYFAAPAPNSYRPEKLTAFELGSKNRFLDNRLQVNVEAFYWKYKNQQQTYAGPVTLIDNGIPLIAITSVTSNAGGAKSYGLDLDLSFKPTRDDEVSFKVQYNKTKFDSFLLANPTVYIGPPVTACAIRPIDPSGNQEVDCSGKPLIRAPLWSGTAGYNRTIDLGDSGSLSLNLNAQFSSGYYIQQSYLPAARQDSYVVGNVNLTYTSPDKRWSLSGFMNNISNEQIFDFTYKSPLISAANPLSGPDGTFLGGTRPPRTYGARLRVDF